MRGWLQIDGWDPVAGAAVTLQATNEDDVATCMAAGGPWWPMIAKMPVLRYDLFDGAFGDQISAPSSSLTMQVEAWPNFARYALTDARIRIWLDLTGSPIFDGRITAQPVISKGQATIQFAVDDRWLDTPLLATYAGTTGAEGPASLKGVPKPLALGAPRYVGGKLIDTVNSVFQVSAYGAVQGFEAAMERLSRFGAPTADYATYAALVAATVPAGQWATAKAVGMARFGAPPNGQISFLVQGDAAGSDGWARKPGQLIRRIAQLSGGTGKIDDASLNALDTARPYNLSIYVDQQTTARTLIQSIAASINAVALVSWTGKLIVLPVGLGTATTTLAADGSALPAVRSVEQRELAPPFKRLSITAERTWTVHALADIAFRDPLVDMGAYNAATTYRAGNIVQSGGSSYRYSNPTPTAGNAPPNATYWAVLAAQGPQGGQGSTGPAGPAAKALKITADRSTINYDGAGAPTLATQTTTFTANKQNTTATVYWSLADATGAAVSVSYLSAASGDSVTMTEAQFAAARGSTSGVLVTASLTDGGTIADKISLARVASGATGAQGPQGATGAAAVGLRLTKKSVQVQAFADGTVKGLDAANGLLTVWSGASDITSGAALSAAGNGCTGTINTAYGTPVANQPKGYYQVTAMSADDATLTLTAVASGQTLTEVFSLGKLKGGYEIVSVLPTTSLFEGRQVYLTTDDKLYRYTGTAWTASVAAPDIAGTLASSQLGIGVGGNLLSGAVPGVNPRTYVLFSWNPDGVTFTDGLTGASATSGQGIVLSPLFAPTNWPGPEWTLSDKSTFAVHQDSASWGTVHVVDMCLVRPIDQNGSLAYAWPVEPNATYEYSIYTGAHRCRVEIFIWWLDANMSSLNLASPTVANDEEKAGGVGLDYYKRLVTRGVAPANARYAQLFIRKFHTKQVAGYTDSWFFGTRPMFGQTTPNATEALPYSVPAYAWLNAENLVARSITTDKLAVNAVTANEIAAGAVNAAKMNVTQLSAITANVGFLTSRSGGQGAGFEQDNNGYRLFSSNNILAIELSI